MSALIIACICNLCSSSEADEEKQKSIRPYIAIFLYRKDMSRSLNVNIILFVLSAIVSSF